MFHPHFLDLFFGNPHSMADTMRPISAFKVERDLQQAWREEWGQRQVNVERIPEELGENDIQLKS